LPAVTIGLTAQEISHADAVIDWNATMLRAIWTDATPPTLASRVEAMVGVAVYDAVDGVHPIYDLYPVPGTDVPSEPRCLARGSSHRRGRYRVEKPCKTGGFPSFGPLPRFPSSLG
jgi:hypothetical protein